MELVDWTKYRVKTLEFGEWTITANSADHAIDFLPLKHREGATAVEAIYVDICSHHPPLDINRGHRLVASALPPKRQGKY